jgi:hypothetical protein
MDFKLELIPVAVSDVDRARAFYEQAGFVVDNDVRVKEGLRFIQLTPPHSRRLGFDALLPLSPEKSSGRGEELVDVVKQGVARPALRAPHGAEAIRHLEPDAVLGERHPKRLAHPADARSAPRASIFAWPPRCPQGTTSASG